MKHLGLIVLAIWLIATGLQAIIDLHFRYDDEVLGALAVAAGVLVLIRR